MRRSQHLREIAIVGGGFSGAMVAYHLLKNREIPLKVNLIEPSKFLGKGAAYSTTESEHLLNVPAGKMSALPDQPDHFLLWLHTRGISAAPTQFVSRSLFGEYIHSLLEEAITNAVNSKLIHHQTTAVCATPYGDDLIIALKNGTQITSSNTVLALGNSTPLQLPFVTDEIAQHTGYIANPWKPGVLKNISPDDEVLILGNGLTMIDTVLSLAKSGHRAKITSISRHGLIPNTHKAADHPANLNLSISPQSTIRETLKLARDRYKEFPQHWRALVDSFRPVTQDFWVSLSLNEKARFLRHLHPYWESVRHRIAPVVSEQLQAKQKNGQLTITRGRIKACNLLSSGRFETQFTTPKQNFQTVSLESDIIINCTGPSQDLRRSISPLFQSLLNKQMISPGPLNLGVACEPVTGAVRDRYGNYSTDLYAIGTLRKGELWESTAVPELRGQASVLASHLIESLIEREQPLVANVG